MPGRRTSGFALDPDTWSLYASAVLLLCLTPGPNSLLAVTNGLRFGDGKTLFSTFGCAAGLTLLIGASLSGLGLILAASETVFHIIKVSIRRGRGTRGPLRDPAGSKTRREVRTGLRGQGLVPGGIPVPRQQLVYPGVRQLSDAGEHIGEPSLRVDIVELGGGDEGVHRRGALAAAVGAAGQP